MPTITLDYTKTVAQNAALYFERAKKAKKKLEGVQTAIALSKAKLAELATRHEKAVVEHEQKAKVVARKKQWYEKFHWTFTPSGILSIGGRDAATNEIIIKKHMEDTDLVFHTEMAGSPFFLLKCGEVKPTDADIEQVAQLTAIYAKGWQKGFSSSAVFYVNPSQVSKEANSGEFLVKGSFMIRGTKTYLHPTLEVYIGRDKDGRCVAGTKSYISSISSIVVRIVQGNQKPSAVAKQISAILSISDLDEIIRMLPASNIAIKKN